MRRVCNVGRVFAVLAYFQFILCRNVSRSGKCLLRAYKGRIRGFGDRTAVDEAQGPPFCDSVCVEFVGRCV